MIDQLIDSLNLIISQTQINSDILIKIVLTLWGVFFLNKLLGNRLLFLGIFPRHILGIPGIFFAPFLHADFNHLFFNTIPLVVLSNFVLINGLTYFWQVTLFITIVSGIGIWLIGKPGVHIGASALITGYWGLLVSDIMQQGTATAFILGIVCIYYFAGIFFGIFPSKRGVSWEGHLCGLAAGIAATFFF